jgi:hypothetical protein
MAIQVDLANEGPPFAGEVRMIGGTQGRTRFAVPVDLPTTSRKAYTLYAQAPAFGSSVEVALVSNEQVIERRSVEFVLHDPGQLVIGVVAERPAPSSRPSAASATRSARRRLWCSSKRLNSPSGRRHGRPWIGSSGRTSTPAG